MTDSESPGAIAALGASEIDQLGSRVDPTNSPTNLRTQALPLRGGNASRCLVCGLAMAPRRASRRQRYCSYPCRDEARRARNFAASAATRRGSPAIPRSVQINSARSTACKAGFDDRTPIELVGHGYRWRGPLLADVVALIRNVIDREIGGVQRAQRTTINISARSAPAVGGTKQKVTNGPSAAESARSKRKDKQ